MRMRVVDSRARAVVLKCDLAENLLDYEGLFGVVPIGIRRQLGSLGIRAQAESKTREDATHAPQKEAITTTTCSHFPTPGQ